jgi:tRNA (guanine37-N1)-methyltransferase
MDFTVLTLFPELFDAFWRHGIIRRAIEGRIIDAEAVNIRGFAAGRHQTTDDRPYGGGCGMVMKPEPLAGAIASSRQRRPGSLTVLLSPQGRPFTQSLAADLAGQDGLILVCGRYEGIDERVCLDLVDVEVSIGDYVLTGGEVAAMIVVDAVTRLLPGALGGADSAADDSFSAPGLEHAQYTRPPVFDGQAVPEVLLSGDHARIARWRRESALIRTLLKRSDLLHRRRLAPEEVAVLRRWAKQIEGIIDAQALPGAGAPPGDQQNR